MTSSNDTPGSSRDPSNLENSLETLPPGAIAPLEEEIGEYREPESPLSTLTMRAPVLGADGTMAGTQSIPVLDLDLESNGGSNGNEGSPAELTSSLDRVSKHGPTCRDFEGILSRLRGDPEAYFPEPIAQIEKEFMKKEGLTSRETFIRRLIEKRFGRNANKILTKSKLEIEGGIYPLLLLFEYHNCPC